MKRDLKDSVDAAIGLAPSTVSATGTGTAVDLKGYDSAMVVVSAGTMATGGTFTPSLTESADGTTYTAVGTGDLQGAFAAHGTGVASVLQRVGYIGTGRYIKTVQTFGGTGAGVPASIAILRGHAGREPI
ncbi:hypothetical protein UFOVP1672_6 [uncultured Caudovirales phage]|uniref:Uncharacterized protein n=1 Tax=uncultured Caudovirales phage TaxID=2100421 RepID=A0A6J5T6L4_9CAUD|nr:hypothetical protein UFOVP988_28 [uncultured Caudovirales phage]CAB4210648.1 hypothetical protein UFOVP1425_28 [uncultured Caudovirales phage]CAB4223249.1 hypothetical protein UFOVP1672_6 [uncultured Caudovirales phage]